MPNREQHIDHLTGSRTEYEWVTGNPSKGELIGGSRQRASAVARRHYRSVLSCFMILPFGLIAVGSHAQSSQKTTHGPVASATSPAGVAPAGTTTNTTAKVGDPSREYKIGRDDLLAINVWHEPDLSRTVPVRPDGKISLPLVGDIQAEGKSATQLQEELHRSLDKYVKDPSVTVMIAEIRSQRINVVGEVGRPGVFPLTESMGVVDALAQAGGLRDFAKKNSIYVLRPLGDGRSVRIDAHYNDVLRGKKNAKDIVLQAHDTVVVP